MQVVTSEPPPKILIIEVLNTITEPLNSSEKLDVDTENLSPVIRIGGNNYLMAGAVYYRSNHFVAALFVKGLVVL